MGKASGAPNKILQARGSTSKIGVTANIEVGTTTKNTREIDAFIANWLSTYPFYHIHGANCQLFAADFAIFLCGPAVTAKMPVNDHNKVMSIIRTGVVLGAT